MKTEVVVAGAGPVGLLLACRLAGAGISVLVLEKRPRRRARSRAIGIHPPGLEVLQELSLAERFVEAGLRIPGGRAFGDGRYLGSVSFSRCPPPYDFVLSLPQPATERILEEALEQRSPQALRRGVSFEGMTFGGMAFEGMARGGPELGDRARGGALVVEAMDREGATLRIECDYVVGCDGIASTVRRAAGIGFDGGVYPGGFVMADLPDTTGLGREALVFLGQRGLVESFPLPGRLRRWVVGTRVRERAPSPWDFRRRIRNRTGHRVEGPRASELSAFRARHLAAESLVRGRVILAGDAAHVVSPIGGQGMNLGWLDARDVAHSLARVLRAGRDPDRELGRYARRARRRWRRARRRAEFNMRLAAPARRPALRRAWVRVLLRSPARNALARIFTMRGL